MVDSFGERRPRWQEIALSAAFTLMLVAFAASATWVAGNFLKTDNGVRLFGVLVLLVIVPFLVHYAYPPQRRRWYHWAGFELCVVAVVLVFVPLAYLPWLIVTRRARRVPDEMIDGELTGNRGTGG